jgi:hypothetical protein
MIVNETQLYIGLMMGLVPYHIERKYLVGNKRTLQVRALFWSLTLHQRRSGRHDWTLCVPLIERLRDAAWAAVMCLRDKQPPQS